jgi:hypothetical protein
MELSAAMQQAAKAQSVDPALLRELGRAVAEFRRDLEAYRRHVATAAPSA